MQLVGGYPLILRFIYLKAGTFCSTKNFYWDFVSQCLFILILYYSTFRTPFFSEPIWPSTSDFSQFPLIFAWKPTKHWPFFFLLQSGRSNQHIQNSHSFQKFHRESWLTENLLSTFRVSKSICFTKYFPQSIVSPIFHLVLRHIHIKHLKKGKYFSSLLKQNPISKY